MKILYLVHRIPYPPNKGEKIRSYHQVKYLAELHSLDLVCLVDDPRDLPHIEALQKFCNRVYAHPIQALPCKAKGLSAQFAGGTLSVGYFHHRAVQKVIDQWLAETDYDGIVCFSSTMAEYVFRSRLDEHLSKPHLIMDFCDVDSDKWRQYAEAARAPLKQIYQREHSRMQQYEKRVHQMFDYSVLVSAQEADLFAAQMESRDKIVVIPNGINADFFSPQNGYDSAGIAQAKAPTIVFTGAMNYHVNVDGALWFCKEVLPLVKVNNPEVSLKIVGSNPTAAVRQLAGQAGIEVTGFVDDIRPYYAMADIFIAPLRMGRGIQNKVLEAMAMERPVVTTSRANAGIRAKSGQHLLVADSAGGFAVAVNELIKSKQVRRQLGRAARNFVVEHFNWEKTLADFAELLAPGISEAAANTSHPSLSSGLYGK